MSFTSKLQILYSVVNLLGILHLLIFSPSEGSTNSVFTTDLIHRDSPLSLFYNPSRSHFDCLGDAFRRSLHRANHFKSVFTRKIETLITPGGGEYLMKMSIGTPPVELVGIVDTGSDLTWTQCKPCIECYKQIPPLFDSTHSSSYQTIPCQTDSCNALGKSICSNSTCAYGYSYGDGSFTGGVLATETITLGSGKSSVYFPHFVFGCGNKNTGIFDKAGSGIIGLDRGNLSLISQLGGSIGKKFSYCIAPTFAYQTPGKITFGSDSMASSKGGMVVTTPIVSKGDNFYWLTLEALSIGNKTIPYNNSEVDTIFANRAGNIIIDSGTTVTFLPYKVYQDLESAVDKVIGGEKIDDPLDRFSLYYKDDGYNIQLPNITAHFKGGDVTLQPINTFQKIAYNVNCLAMVGADFGIYGNLAQMNFIVGFNLEASTLSIQPAPCTQLDL